MRRRRLLLALGGTGLSGGCLRLQQEEAEASTAQGTTATESTDIADSTEPATESSSGAENVQLTEPTFFNQDVNYVWSEGLTYYFNGFNGAGATGPSGDLNWSGSKTIENGGAHLGADRFAKTDVFGVFGFTADPNAEGELSEQGAHFYAHNIATGQEQWTFTAPSDGNHRHASGAAIVEGTAVLGASDWGDPDQQSPVVYGVNLALGEQQWKTTTPDLPRGYISGIVGYDGEIHLFLDSEGTYILDPADGTVLDQRESLRVNAQVGRPTVRGGSVYTRSGNKLTAYQLENGTPQWEATELGRLESPPAVDNTLVVAGTRDGTIVAVERTSGEQRWQRSIEGFVYALSLTASHVWVADAQSSLFGLSREDGSTLFRGTYEIANSDIATLSESIMIGGESSVYRLENE